MAQQRGDSSAAAFRTAVIEDDTLMREALAGLEDAHVVAAYSNVEAFLTQLPRVDVVLLDLWIRPQVGTQPPLRGIQAIGRIASRGYRILLYTSESRPAVLAGCLAAGAHGVVLKTEGRDALVAAVQHVAEGGFILTNALAGLAEVYERRGLLPAFNSTKVEVLRGRARGESYRLIGQRLNITPKTAEGYMSEIGQAFLDCVRRIDLNVRETDPRSAATIELVLGLRDGDLLDPGPHGPQSPRRRSTRNGLSETD